MEDTLGEFVSSEQLQIFDVVESFCNICQSNTPHHLDNSIIHNDDDEISEDAQCIGAISNQECVYCRESEEEKLAIF